MEGIVLKRVNPFIMQVQIGGETLACRCPTTWHIGNLDVAGRPCLLSRNEGVDRKTPFTVEAVSLDSPECPDKKWIGINLTAANRYVEHYLAQGGFEEVVGRASKIHRTRLSGKANLDFVVNNTAVAIKAPLMTLGLVVPPQMQVPAEKPFPSTDRFVRRITSLRKASGEKRTVLLTVYLYERPDFHISEFKPHYDAVLPVAERSAALGIENWQVNFVVDKDGVHLDRCVPLSTKE